MSLVVQGKGGTFGPKIAAEFDNPNCVTIDIAVAWVRATGLRHLAKGMTDALARGAVLRVFVGLDGDNTSYEGLEGLLAIAATAPGQMTTIVRHNEAGLIFHPKLYSFWGTGEVRAYIGSNNLTQAGLFLNEELSFLTVHPRPSTFADELAAYLGSLMPPASGLSKDLDAALLALLLDRGYVEKEAALRAKARARRGGVRKAPLFGSQSRSAPTPPPAPSVPLATPPADEEAILAPPDWQRLTLRLRISRGTQGQIPIGVVREMRRRVGQPVTASTLNLKARDGTERKISPAGAENTYKIEALDAVGEPILLVYPVGKDLFYELLDSGTSGVGAELYAQLLAGLSDDPPRTAITRNPAGTATWWRFD